MKILLWSVPLCAVLFWGQPSDADSLIRPKVIIVATFEVGKDMGDAPGEFQFWVEREKLLKTMTVPGVDHIVRYNDAGTFGVVSGTTSRAGLQIMALCLDPRFDLSHTYWIVNGIAGVNPSVASIGSAAWAAHVVDGDIAYEIDSREIPADWPYGIVPIGSKVPNTPPDPAAHAWAPDPMSWTINPALVQWAFHLTEHVTLMDTPEAQKFRALYTPYPIAQKPPFVLIGDSFCSCRYWHGADMAQWASDWDKLYTDGQGQFAMTAMEDQGIAGALLRLSKMKKVDFQRVLFLRTGSNYCLPYPGETAAQSMTSEYAGMIPALEAAYRTGSVVLHELENNWSKYKVAPPK
jgi:purine nucleoside permease